MKIPQHYYLTPATATATTITTTSTTTTAPTGKRRWQRWFDEAQPNGMGVVLLDDCIARAVSCLSDPFVTITRDGHIHIVWLLLLLLLLPPNKITNTYNIWKTRQQHTHREQWAASNSSEQYETSNEQLYRSNCRTDIQFSTGSCYAECCAQNERNLQNKYMWYNINTEIYFYFEWNIPVYMQCTVMLFRVCIFFAIYKWMCAAAATVPHCMLHIYRLHKCM